MQKEQFVEHSRMSIPFKRFGAIAKHALCLIHEAAGQHAIVASLKLAGYQVTLCSSAASALLELRSASHELVLIALKFPGIDGVKLCRQLSRSRSGYLPMIVAVAHRHQSEALNAAIEAGADDILYGELSVEELRVRLRILEEHQERFSKLTQAERALHSPGAGTHPASPLVETLAADVAASGRFGRIIGKSPAMLDVYQFILNAAETEASVAIYGESGTGKELVAQTIHQMSRRKHAKFVAVNCGAIPETLFESEFFGYRKGAFTGAAADKKGFLDLAHQGTLFLDEVGELMPTMQVKLLRALQNGEYTPVGDNVSQRANVRVIAATNQELREQIRKGVMREDFFYRIHVIAINLPPLRSRKEDLPLLIEHFLQQQGEGLRLKQLPNKMFEALLNYDWPGNIRELHNELHRYLATGQLELHRSIAASLAQEKECLGESVANGELPLQDALEAVEKFLIEKTLDRAHWNRGKAAQKLGIPTRTLHRKMTKYQLI